MSEMNEIILFHKIQNEIILLHREEATQLASRVITDHEWDTIKEWIITDDNMWQVIDECIKNTINEIVKDK